MKICLWAPCKCQESGEAGNYVYMPVFPVQSALSKTVATQYMWSLST